MTPAIAALLLVSAPPEKPRTSLLERASIGGEAPMFRLPVLGAEGSAANKLRLERHVGARADEPRRAVILSFAASYCEPCERELALLKSLASDLSSAGVLLAVIIVDYEPEGAEKMRALAADKLQLPYPLLSDEYRLVARRYGAETLPTIALVDGTGILRWLHSGFSETMLDELRSELAKIGIEIRRPEPPASPNSRAKKPEKKGPRR